jgi:autotransporter-associated beta strand protein
MTSWLKCFLVGWVLVIALAAPEVHAQLPAGTWQYHWGDEFNDSTLDTMKWSVNYPWGPTHNHDAYMSADNVILGDGTLTLEATRQSQGGKPFSSGAVSTGYTKFTVSGGYIEARILLPDTPGSWPAFWGLYQGWPPEADIMEYPIDTAAGSGYSQDHYHTAFHYSTGSGNAAGAGQVNPGSAGDLGGAYHNFGMEWRADDWVGFYFDGVRVSEFGTDSAIAQMENMYLILNYAVGGWPGQPNTTEWPNGHTDEMKVDWVRVWKQEGIKTTNWVHNTAAQDVSWNTGSNWSNGSPNLAGITANFSTVTAPEQRITWSGIRSISNINFDGSSRYRLGNSNGRLLMAGANNLTGTASINVSASSTASIHEIVTPLELRSDTIFSNNSSQLLQITGNITGDSDVIIDGSGDVVFNSLKSYRGDTNIKNGRLLLSGSAPIPFTPRIDIRSGATLDASALSGVVLISNGRTLNNESGGTVMGSVSAVSGGTIEGSGTFAGNINSQSGSLVRVGRDGLGPASRFVIDDFESYNLGDVRDVANPPWTAHLNSSLVDIESISGNKVLSFGWISDFRGTSRNLPTDAVLDNGETATVFFRVNARTDLPNHNVGLADIADTNAANFADFESQLRIKAGTAGTFAIDARNGGAFTSTLASGLALNSWYNVWMVVNQSSDTYDLYMNTGTGDATPAQKLNATPLSFRNGTGDSLTKFLALSGSAPVDNGVLIDDITYLSGVDLTNPLLGLDPGVSAASMTMLVTGNFTQQANATLELDIFSPTTLDLLEVGGHLSVAGELRVSLVSGAPTPAMSDLFKILDFGTASGEFASFDLPLLDTGLAWNVTNLLTTGELEVAADVDLDNDGDVDGRDFLLIQRTAPELTASWQTQYGNHLVQPSVGTVSIPEPSSLVALLTLTGALAWRWPRSGTEESQVN